MKPFSFVLAAALVAVGAAALAPLASARSDQEYRFRKIDPPFGDPEVDMDVQSFYVADDGVASVQYQIPRSGVCCALTPEFFDNVHMAVRLGRTWKKIDVPDASTTLGTAPNERGEVGLTYPVDGVWHSAVWNPRRGLTSFPNLANFPGGLLATGLNDRGRIAAYAYDSTGHSHAFFGDLQHHTVVDYPGPDVTDTLAQFESDAGVRVGAYILSDGSLHAFAERHGQFVTIDPPGSVAAIALAVNNDGVIVGGYFDATGSLFGFIKRGNHFSDFRVPGSTLTIPWLINDSGQVSGTYSESADPLFHGVFHGFLATPLEDRD